MDLELHNKVDKLLEIQVEDHEKINALYKCIYIGNGEPSLKVDVDRNKRAIKLLLWVVGVLFVTSAAAVAANIF